MYFMCTAFILVCFSLVYYIALLCYFIYLLFSFFLLVCLLYLSLFLVSVDFMFFFFKQRTAYEMRISDWSSDVCSSDLKVTGVTVGLLAIGLVAAGFGTMAFLRNTLVANLDEQLRLLAASDIADTVFTADTVDGKIEFTPRDDVAPTGSMIVIYRGVDGSMAALYDGTTAHIIPALPQTFPLQDTNER